MKSILFLGLCGVAFAFYTDIDDKIDMDAIVADPEQTKKNVECLLNMQPCSDAMNSYKKHIVEFMQNKCQNCSPIQKHKIEELLNVIETKYPGYLQKGKKLYDAEGKYFKAFDDEMTKY